MLLVLLSMLTLLALPLVAPPAAALRHPHFPKRVEMRLGFEAEAPTLAVSHNTVTFDKEGFEKLPVGTAWHLANAKLHTEVALTLGGRAVAPGSYRLLARKTAQGFELLLDASGRDFSSAVSDAALVLDTAFRGGAPRQEHLRIDLQPSGAREATMLNLEVHFDEFVAITRVEVESED